MHRIGIRWTAAGTRRGWRPFSAFVPAFCVALLAQCVPDYLGTPRTPAFSFQVIPETAWVAVGDTVPSPFRCTLEVDGSPVPCGIRLTSDRVQELLQVEPDGSVRAVRRGPTAFSASPVSLLGAPETVRRDVLLIGFYARLAIPGSGGPLCADTLRSLGDTIALSAEPRTRRNEPLPGLYAAPIWRVPTNQGVVAVLDSGFASPWGVVRAEANGAATLRAVEDSAAIECDVVVFQRAASLDVPVSLDLPGPGATAQLTAGARDLRGRPAPNAAVLVRWWSLDTSVVAADSLTGVVTGVRPGATQVIAAIGVVTRSVTVSVGAGP